MLHTPTLEEVKIWFSKVVLPKRTAWAGFSPNRILHGPRSLFAGNEANPNGVCGDCALYVGDAFFESFNGYTTSDGLSLCQVVWDGMLQNHVANILVPSSRKSPRGFKLVNGNLLRIFGEDSADGAFTKDELFSLTVLDLYYKKVYTLGAWWDMCDDGRDGKIAIAEQWQIEDAAKKL